MSVFQCPVCDERFRGKDENIRERWSNHMQSDGHIRSSRDWLTENLKLVNGLDKDEAKNCSREFIYDCSFHILWPKLKEESE